VQAVLDAAQRIELGVEAARHGGGERGVEVAFDVHRLVEVRLQQAEVAAQIGGHQRAVGAEHHAEQRLLVTRVVDSAIRRDDRERHAGTLPERVDQVLHQRPHGP
jgi:hypothetical protein